MKTPRELLTARHAAAKGKLDAIAAAVLRQTTTDTVPSPFERFREWMWPSPLAWAGVAAVWAVLAAINTDVSDLRNVPVVAFNVNEPARLQAMRIQRRLYVELVTEETAATTLAPRPRSERILTTAPANG